MKKLTLFLSFAIIVILSYVIYLGMIFWEEEPLPQVEPANPTTEYQTPYTDSQGKG